MLVTLLNTVTDTEAACFYCSMLDSSYYSMPTVTNRFMDMCNFSQNYFHYPGESLAHISHMTLPLSVYVVQELPRADGGAAVE